MAEGDIIILDNQPSGKEPLRDELGRWLPGSTGNTAGTNGTSGHWQPYSERLKKWFEMPIEELRALARNRKELRKRSAIDVACIMHVAGTIRGQAHDRRAERESAIDRIEGTVKKRNEITGADGKPLFDPKAPPVVAATEEAAFAAMQETIRRS